jgi:lipopolysaccharide export system protein LptC
MSSLRARTDPEMSQRVLLLVIALMIVCIIGYLYTLA